MSKSVFINCEKCGKRLIERKEDGLLHFAFGKSLEEDVGTPVEMYIYGSIRIKCIRKRCNHWNLLNQFSE